MYFKSKLAQFQSRKNNPILLTFTQCDRHLGSYIIASIRSKVSRRLGTMVESRRLGKNFRNQSRRNRKLDFRQVYKATVPMNKK